MSDDAKNGERIEVAAVNPRVVSALEQLLAEAKKGNLQGILCVGLNAQGFSFEIPVVPNAGAACILLGAVEVMKLNVGGMVLQARAQQQSPIMRASPDQVTGLFRR